jgi:hypothetical protein
MVRQHFVISNFVPASGTSIRQKMSIQNRGQPKERFPQQSPCKDQEMAQALRQRRPGHDNKVRQESGVQKSVLRAKHCKRKTVSDTPSYQTTMAAKSADDLS